MANYFITGIGTDVGKTVVGAILTEALEADYWKPVQCGVEEGTDKDTIKTLISNTKTVIHPEAYCLKEPASPHLAAQLENTKIVMERIIPPHTENTLIIEGAGGILVPLNDSNFVIDIARDHEMEIILVIKNYLGCINHSLLSIDYLLKNGYEIKGLVLNGNFDKVVKNTILNYAELPLIAELNDLSEVSRDTVKANANKVDLSLFNL